MVGVDAQVRLVEERVEHLQPGLLVAIAVGAARRQDAREPQQPLRGDRRRGAVDRLVIVERIGGRSRQSPSAARPGAPASQYGTPSAAAISM